MAPMGAWKSDAGCRGTGFLFPLVVEMTVSRWAGNTKLPPGVNQGGAYGFDD
jgi:hypothetical protein